MLADGASEHSVLPGESTSISIVLVDSVLSCQLSVVTHRRQALNLLGADGLEFILFGVPPAAEELPIVSSLDLLADDLLLLDHLVGLLLVVQEFELPLARDLSSWLSEDQQVRHVATCRHLEDVRLLGLLVLLLEFEERSERHTG